MMITRPPESKDFKDIVRAGNLSALEDFNNKNPNILAKYCCAVFNDAAEYGHDNVLDWMKKYIITPQILQETIGYLGYQMLCNAACNGHVSVFRWVRAQVDSEEQFRAMIDYDDYDVLTQAAEYHHLFLLEYLKENITGFFENTHWRYNRYELDVNNFIFSSLPFNFYYIDGCSKYRDCVHSFVTYKLGDLHKQQQTFAASHPNEPFNITNEAEAKLCYFIARHLIFRSHDDRTLNDELRFLLSISSVGALAHQEIIENRPNELAYLAIKSNNEEATQILLKLPAVKALTAANDYYQYGYTQWCVVEEESKSEATSIAPQQNQSNPNIYWNVNAPVLFNNRQTELGNPRIQHPGSNLDELAEEAKAKPEKKVKMD